MSDLHQFDRLHIFDNDQREIVITKADVGRLTRLLKLALHCGDGASVSDKDI